MGLNPASVLGRGYAVLEKNGRAVAGIGDLTVFDAASVVMHDGAAEVTVNWIDITKLEDQDNAKA